MERQIATLDNGQLVLTPDVQSALGLPSGSRAEVLVGDNDIRIVVPDKPRVPRNEAERLIAELRGMFAGEPSLEDEFFRTRDKDKW